jgi:hypothetical protein
MPPKRINRDMSYNGIGIAVLLYLSASAFGCISNCGNSRSIGAENDTIIDKQDIGTSMDTAVRDDKKVSPPEFGNGSKLVWQQAPLDLGGYKCYVSTFYTSSSKFGFICYSEKSGVESVVIFGENGWSVIEFNGDAIYDVEAMRDGTVLVASEKNLHEEVEGKFREIATGNDIKHPVYIMGCSQKLAVVVSVDKIEDDNWGTWNTEDAISSYSHFKDEIVRTHVINQGQDCTLKGWSYIPLLMNCNGSASTLYAMTMEDREAFKECGIIIKPIKTEIDMSQQGGLQGCSTCWRDNEDSALCSIDGGLEIGKRILIKERGTILKVPEEYADDGDGWLGCNQHVYIANREYKYSEKGDIELQEEYEAIQVIPWRDSVVFLWAKQGLTAYDGEKKKLIITW